MLPGAEEIPRAPELQVLLCDGKPVGGGGEGFQPLSGQLVPVVREKHTIGWVLPPPHPASELVELAKAEPVRVLHNHQAGVGHVHPHLNDRGGYQDIHFPCGKGRHDPLLVPCLLLSVDNSHPQIGKDLFLELAAILLRRLQSLRVLLVHRRADNIHLAALGHLLPDKGIQPRPLVLPDQIGSHRGAPRGKLVNDRQIQVPIDHQRQGPGNGGG